jgi:hypothetical protein
MSIDLDAIEAMTSDPYQYAQVSPEVTRGYLAALVAEVRTLRAVAEEAGELTYAVGNAGAAAVVHAVDAVDAALDAWRAGGGAA